MQEILTDASHRAALYRLLAQLFAEEITPSLLTRLSEGEIRAACPQLADALPHGEPTAICEELAIEFCSVFVGPTGHVPPIQSVWSTGQLNSEVVARLETYQAIIGLPPPWTQTLVTDHLANSLDLMGALLQRVPELSNTDETDSDETDSEIAALADLAASLLVDHLQWTETMLRRVIEHPNAHFYRVVTTLTREFLSDESKRLRPVSN